MIQYEHLIVERRGPVGWLIFNRPAVLNAINGAMGLELAAAWRELSEDDTVRVIVNTGRGRGFQVGVDLKELDARRAAGTAATPENAQTARGGAWSTARDAQVWKPVICAVNGICIGMGFHFVDDADIVVASTAATFCDTHTSVGLVSAYEPIGLLPKIGFGAVMRMVLLGRHEQLDARRAYELGLVSDVLDADQFEPLVQDLAERIARNSPSALMASKMALWQAIEPDLERAYENGERLIRAHLASPDVAEGATAFVEKRDPVWAPGRLPS
jgi:enoyl-CoA hydratase/carnithine racemase